MTTPTKVWGRAAWTYMKAAARSEHASTEDLVQLVRAVGATLPCPECRSHFAMYLERHPPHFATPLAAQRWIEAAEEAVGARVTMETLQGSEPPSTKVAAPKSHVPVYGRLRGRSVNDTGYMDL